MNEWEIQIENKIISSLDILDQQIYIKRNINIIKQEIREFAIKIYKNCGSVRTQDHINKILQSKGIEGI